jgi:hypothetical protein
VQTIHPGSRAHIKIDFEPGIKHPEVFAFIIINILLLYCDLQYAQLHAELPKPEAVQEIAKPQEQGSKALKPRSYSKKSSSSRAIPNSTSTIISEAATTSPPSATKSTADKKSRKKKGSTVVSTAEAELPAAPPQVFRYQ